MEKKYIDCKLGLTPGCPKWENSIWSRLILKEIKPGEGISLSELSYIDIANALCQNCDSFTLLNIENCEM